ncbi:MAG: baseplate J/gp47 family protein [Vallitalea sp.]|jgi:uncharacterized phage protein gp47/JayE|nr:baseplate J/gp47 family protein [Vallitalea sp.]
MYENIDYETIKLRILSKIHGIDKNEGSFVNDMVSPVSMELESIYVELEKLLSTMFLEDMSKNDLEKRCSEYGIYRKKGSCSEGIASFSGLENTAIPINTLVSTNTALNFVTIEEMIIPEGTAKVDVGIKAIDVGSKYNVQANAINTLPVGINGITSVTNKNEMIGGTNIEADEELLDRLFLRLKTPATSGNKEHYKLWTMEIDGVGGAKIFPLWNGNGTVQIIPITTHKRCPTQAIINKIIVKIEEKRPIGATVTVTPPQENKIDVTATIVLNNNADIESVKNEYGYKFTKYISDSVFKVNIVDYFKCLSLFYEIEGIKTVTDFKINGTTNNIVIPEKEIQVVGIITIN